VSFEELRSHGIENPAVLAYELDLVGMPIERVHRYDAPGRAVPVGVRIGEPDATPATLVQSARPRYPPPPRVGHRRWRAQAARQLASASLRARIVARSIAAHSILARASQRRALAAPIALIVVVGAVTASALTSQAPRGASPAAARADIDTNRVSHTVPEPTRQAAQPLGGAARQETHPIAAAAPARAAGESKATSTQETAATSAPHADRPGASGGSSGRPPEQARAAGASSSAAQLQADGHQLLGDGRYAAARAGGTAAPRPPAARSLDGGVRAPGTGRREPLRRPLQARSDVPS
jgi:hypothetical protein